MLSPVNGLPAGDLTGDMEALAVTAAEGAEEGATTSPAEVEAVGKAEAPGEMESSEGAEEGATASQARAEAVGKVAAPREVESPERACPCGKVVGPEGAKPVETSENPEAGRTNEALESFAQSIVTKALQLAMAEVGIPAALGSGRGEGAGFGGAVPFGQAHRYPMGWEAAAPAPELSLALPSECLRWMRPYSCLASSYGRDLNLKKLKAIGGRKKIPEIPAESLCFFPIWFPSVFQMSFFFHNSGHFITPGIVKDTKRSPLQPHWPHAHPVLKHSYLGIKKGPRVVFTQTRIFI